MFKKATTFLSSELISVLLTALTGFIIIQHLSKDVYGVYGFLVAAISLMTALSEIGMNHCFLPMVGYENVNESKIQQVYIFFKKIRNKLIILSAVVVIIPTFWLLFTKQWLTPIYSTAIILMMIGAILEVNSQLLRLRTTASNNYKLVSKINVYTSFIRTVFIVGSIYLLPENYVVLSLAFSPITGALIGIWAYNHDSNFEAIKQTILSAVDFETLNKNFRKIYNPLFLPAFLYILYGSFGSMAIAWFGNLNAIANVNAAGRLGMMLILVDKFVGMFIVPKLAQTSSGTVYFALFKKYLLLFLVLIILIVLSVKLFPEFWLLLIGSKYNDLKDILWLSFAATVLLNLSGFIFSCMAARGFTGNQLPILVIAIIVQFNGIYFLGMETAKAVFLISLMTSSIFALGQLILFVKRYKTVINN
jgi:O-antigen/teichoic acid export membrane protein